ITRTFYFGEITEELQRAYDAVLRANTNARSMKGPDLIARDIDHEARKTITDAGFGEYFIHRTGHGLG
ncbi:MAG: M24 family metallopeptidase, partial [Phycisphaerae bacterium]|nr:M24 family metallopeptidase [Phycisphaerae bacterium]